jgi:hypothetical protein
MRSLPPRTSLRRRYGTRPRALRNGSTSRRGRRARLSSRSWYDTWGSMLLVALALGVPVIVAANPVDSTWLPGLYDDADTDQLVTQTMSPEAWIGLTVLVIVYCLSSRTIVGPNALWSRTAARGGLSARAPPRLPDTSARVFALDLRYAEHVRLAQLLIQRKLRSSPRCSPPSAPPRRRVYL